MMTRCTLLPLEVLVTEVVFHEVLVEVHQEDPVVHLVEVDPRDLHQHLQVLCRHLFPKGLCPLLYIHRLLTGY